MKIEQYVEALKKNHYGVIVCETKEQARDYLKSKLTDNKIVAVGGSVTLTELDAIEMIRHSDVHFLDRYDPTLSNEERVEVLRQGLLSDLFITSTNAITAEGNLYNIDGTGNRVSAMIFGPKEVVVVVGYNKLFETEAEALNHIATVAAPKNCIRLNRKTPCTVTGACANCFSEDRICSSYVKLSWQKTDRIKVVIVKENLGY